MCSYNSLSITRKTSTNSSRSRGDGTNCHRLHANVYNGSGTILKAAPRKCSIGTPFHVNVTYGISMCCIISSVCLYCNFCCQFVFLQSQPHLLQRVLHPSSQLQASSVIDGHKVCGLYLSQQLGLHKHGA